MNENNFKTTQAIAEEKQSHIRRPEWLKVRVPAGENYEFLKTLLRTQHLHTVCEEANCPNMGECWGARTATFLILGDICTRNCAFCDVKTGKPGALDWEEPERVAQSVKALNLKHAVITSVNRDERDDGGAPIFAGCIERIREVQPGCSVEVLIPDFKGSQEALKIVMEARPEILGHNVETVPRLFQKVQPQDRCDWAMTTLKNAKQMNAEVLTKSGLMLGLGEEWEEILAVMRDLRACDVDIFTLGQYLQPNKQRNAPVERYYPPEEFEQLRQIGYEMGFRWVESGPLVRSSYHAEQQVSALSSLAAPHQPTA